MISYENDPSAFQGKGKGFSLGRSILNVPSKHTQAEVFL